MAYHNRAEALDVGIAGGRGADMRIAAAIQQRSVFRGQNGFTAPQM
jgi:hypothetical protein